MGIIRLPALSSIGWAEAYLPHPAASRHFNTWVPFLVQTKEDDHLKHMLDAAWNGGKLTLLCYMIQCFSIIKTPLMCSGNM